MLYLEPNCKGSIYINKDSKLIPSVILSFLPKSLIVEENIKLAKVYLLTTRSEGSNSVVQPE
jgi:hypothetical protein